MLLPYLVKYECRKWHHSEIHLAINDSSSVTFFNHNFVNCKATLIVAIKIVSQWLQAGLPVKDGGLL